MARRDDDDAPWLAEAGGRQRTTVSRRSLFWTLVIGLGLATIVAVGLVLLFTRKDTGSTQGYMNAEQAPLITAEPGPYKITPADPKGLQVDGEGQTIYAAGEGIDPGSVIDTSALPEAPLPRPGTDAPPGPPTDLLSATGPADPAAPVAEPPKAAAKPPAKPPANPPVSTAKPMVSPPATTAKPPLSPPATVAKPPATTAKSSGIVQLGAFSSSEKAEEAWGKLSARHGLTGKRIVAVTTNGKTLYRLRSSGDANAICARLKAAGDPCAVVE
jgi:cell division septation protein DedD